MKLAIFTDTFSPQINGVTKILEKMLEHFSRHKIEYVVFAPDAPGASNADSENLLRLASFKFLFYPECRIALPNYLKIRRRLNSFDPDLIHLVTEFNLGLTGLHCAKSKNIAVVSSYHTNITSFLGYYNFEMLEKPAWKYLRWFHNQCRITYCPSTFTMNELRDRGFLNLEVWKRGIDADRFAPRYRDEGLREELGVRDKTVILYVGRLAPEKNLNVLVDSMKILNQKYGDKIALIMTGEGPLMEKLQKVSPANVIFTGYKTGKELVKVYASSDIFAFPSITETYGNVVLEAMATGLPVVAIPAGGVKENLKHGVNGLACEKNDPGEFARMLENLIKDSHLSQHLGANARKHALTQSWEEQFKRLLGGYQRIIEDHCLQENKPA